MQAASPAELSHRSCSLSRGEVRRGAWSGEWWKNPGNPSHKMMESDRLNHGGRKGLPCIPAGPRCHSAPLASWPLFSEEAGRRQLPQERLGWKRCARRHYGNGTDRTRMAAARSPCPRRACVQGQVNNARLPSCVLTVSDSEPRVSRAGTDVEPANKGADWG